MAEKPLGIFRSSSRLRPDCKRKSIRKPLDSTPPPPTSFLSGMSAPKLIIAVCTANVCRSPMAEALLRHALRAEPEPLRSCKVVSAGVAARPGEKMSENSRTALAKVGLRIDEHLSRVLDSKLAAEADLILCMTESHRAVIQLALNPAPENIYLWREFMPGNADREIGDPFGGSIREYEACRDEMVDALPSLLAHLRSL